MHQSEYIFLAIITCFVVFAIVRAYRMRDIRCPECGERMALERVIDPMGGNLTTRVTFSFYSGPRKYKESWRCEACNHVIEKKYWGS